MNGPRCYKQSSHDEKSGTPPVKATSFLDLVRDGPPRPLSAPASSRQDVITSLDPLMQAQAELTLKRIGEAGTQTHLILANPVTGDIESIHSPGTGAMVRERREPGEFLTSADNPHANSRQARPGKIHIDFTGLRPYTDGWSSHVPGSISQRKDAFNTAVNCCGEGQGSLCAEGIRHRPRPIGEQNLAVDPVAPMAMAQTYSLMATLGNASPLGPGIKILGESTADSPVDQKDASR